MSTLSAVNWNVVPSREEISRRIQHGVTIRQSELWLAAELENAARLLRVEDNREYGMETVHASARSLKKTIDVVVGCIK